MRAALFSVPLIAGLAGWVAFSGQKQGNVVVLDDFESPDSAQRWEGPVVPLRKPISRPRG